MGMVLLWEGSIINFVIPRCFLSPEERQDRTEVLEGRSLYRHLATELEELSFFSHGTWRAGTLVLLYTLGYTRWVRLLTEYYPGRLSPHRSHTLLFSCI